MTRTNLYTFVLSLALLVILAPHTMGEFGSLLAAGYALIMGPMLIWLACDLYQCTRRYGVRQIRRR